MPFQKGISKVPGSGKKKGSKDQKTLAWERIGEYVIGEGADRYLQIISDLPDKDFLNEFRAIVEFFRPKLRRSEITAEVNSNELSAKIRTVYEQMQLEPEIPDSIPEYG